VLADFILADTKMTRKKDIEQTVCPDWLERWSKDHLDALKQGSSMSDWEVLRPQFAAYLRLLLQDLEKRAKLLRPDDSEPSD